LSAPVVASGRVLELQEKAAFGAIVLSGHGTVAVDGRKPLAVESASMFPTRDALGGDEFFVAAGAAAKFRLACASIESLHVYQHFASGSNPEARNIAVPEHRMFG